jgi:steroid delta-isomerase-like uncharacterized protein
MPTELKEEIKYRELINTIYNEVWNKRNPSILDEYMASDVKCHEAGMEINSFKDFKENLKIIFNAFEETKFTITNQLVKDNVVVVRFVFEGIHKGFFMNVPPTHKRINFSGLEVISFADGKISEIWAEFDQLGLLKQLGMELRPNIIAP